MNSVFFEKIETTYGNFYNMLKENNEDEYFIKTHDDNLTFIHAAVEKSVDQMYKIEFEDGYIIECADTHVFMDKTGNPVFAKDLVKNNRILSTFGTIAIKSIKKTKTKIAYDINIDSPHWYTNDENGIIHHNTMLSLYCMKAYLEKYSESIALFYDSEFGVTPEYLKSFKIDTSRVIHIPIENVEQLKFDIVKKLEAVDKKEKVFVLIDSIGNLASKKEVEDAGNEKSVADMSRAKSLKSLFRIITPHLTMKKIPCIAVNHIYMEQCLDGSTLIKTPSGSTMIKDIKAGDFVYALNGIQKVLHTYKPEDLNSKGKRFLELEFDDGTKIKCTHDHKFLMKTGKWIEAEKINLHDEFY